MAKKPEFHFRVAPHAIEDLGSNLYTSFPRVLAEFVANAYDADADKIEISIDFKKVTSMRKLMRQHYEKEVAEASGAVTPLAERLLPDSIAIEIRDDGFGMAESDLNDRFLWTARRRREHDEIERSKKGRPLMGRKGLGKLAGFGVARVMEVITKRENAEEAVFVKLDYDEILKHDSIDAVPLDGGINTSDFKKRESGTIIRLSRLSFDALKSKPATVIRELSEHFEFIDPEDFQIILNDHKVPNPGTKFAFAWPNPKVARNKLVAKTLETDHGNFEFEYRIRFRQDRKSLPAQKRGVRVYTHNRMAASPSLFDADTNMHGFRMTDYLDGVVKADFIDDQPRDYIATDRQSLTWETPLLSPLKEFLSAQIKEACKEYQKVRDADKKNEVLDDEFTSNILDSQPLSSREKTVARRLAVNLASISKKGVEDEKYKQLLPDFMLAFGQGNLYEKLSEMAEVEHPNIKELITEVVKLNRLELDRSTSIIKSRLKAIHTLEKEVQKTPIDKGGRNEGEIQQLFEEAPWLVDPLYHDYLSADKSMNTTLKNLARELGIDRPVLAADVADVANREPDFVFLIGDDPLHYVVIVELKAANKYAEIDDLLQLRRYMDTAESWLTDNKHRAEVRGELICTPPPHQSRKREHHDFRIEQKKLSPGDDHRIRSYTRVVEETKKAHDNIIKIAEFLTDQMIDQE